MSLINQQKIQGIGAVILQEDTRADAISLLLHVIDYIARHSGDREIFWCEISDLVDAMAEAVETSTAIH